MPQEAYQKQLMLSAERSKHPTQDVNFLLESLAEQLLSRMDYLKLTPKRILVLNDDQGNGIKLLRKRFPNAYIISMDLICSSKSFFSENVANAFCRADLNTLPLATHTVDCIFANAVMPFILDYEAFWQECLRVLTPGGVVLFSGLCTQTLKELRACFKHFQREESINIFLDMHDIGDSLLHAGFQDPAVDSEMVELRYSNIKNLLHELKKLRSIKLWETYSHQYVGKNFWQALEEFYRAHYASSEKKLIATFEICYGIAFGPSQRTVSAETVSIPISQIKKFQRPH